jgi:hypothetical protein
MVDCKGNCLHAGFIVSKRILMNLLPKFYSARKKPMKELWNWERCKAKICSLKGRLGFPEDSVLRFLGLSLHLEDGSVHDDLTNCPLKHEYRTLSDIYCILSYYADAEPVPAASNLITSKQLQGGQYCNVMVGRAKSTILDVFGSWSKSLVDSARILGGSEVNFGYGDHSVWINSLPLVRLTIVLSGEDSEFPASAQIFFDESITNYLELEQIGMISELTASRLKQAYQCLHKER